MGPGEGPSDQFGYQNLRAVSEGVRPEHLTLLAPAPSSATRRAAQGLHLQGELTALDALKALAERPEKSIRILFTGHGWPQGIWLGQDKRGEDLWLTPPDLSEAVTRARREGKTVKGEFLTCYGGLFGEAFMPGAGLAPACAVFSTVPEKRAEGCYEDGAEARMDYLFSAAREDSCPPGRDFHEVHGRVMALAAGYDIPMLSSDYFLLYGSAARWLGRQARAPYPARGLVRRRLADGTVVYADLVNSRVIKAVRAGGVLPRPEVSVTDCLAEPAGAEPACDDLHRSDFFLHRSVAGAGDPPPDCVPVLRLAWPLEAGASTAAFVMAAEPGDEIWEAQASSATLADFQRDLSAEELRVPLDDLKPAARLVLARLLPRFSDDEHGEALAARLEGLAGLAESQDRARGQALRALIAEMRRRAARPKASDGGTRFWGSWLKTYLIELANENDTEEENLDYSRLAMVTAVTVAESDLRDAARTEEAALRLVADLESLRACERSLP